MKLKSGMIVATVFALWFSVYFGEKTETVVAYILILSFGILHGSNDIRLIRTITKSDSKSSMFKVLLSYISVVLAILVLFFYFPILALITFIVISGYHFGEQHLRKKIVSNSIWNTILFTIYGLFILFMVFSFQSEQVLLVLEEIMGMGLSKSVLDYCLIALGALLFILGGFYFLKQRITSNVLEELFILLVFFIIFKTASLLWGFCIYFIIWHSIPSLKDQMDYLYGISNWKTFKLYVKESFLYWAISVLGLFLLLWFLKDQSFNMISILIFFLAAITFPHVIVMSKLEDEA
ncbi:MAG: Brp/Blh family beta-carotene 15,15'-dioxygenase [Bacteroidota bacterium]